MAVNELVLGVGVGTSGIISSKGRRKVEVGDSTISREFETSTHETDLGMVGTLVLEEGLALRRLVDILRQSLPSDTDRLGLNGFFSRSGSSSSTTSAGSILSSGSDNLGLGLGRVGLEGPRIGIVTFGVLLNDSFDRKGASAFESGCPISLFERCTPG